MSSLLALLALLALLPLASTAAVNASSPQPLANTSGPQPLANASGPQPLANASTGPQPLANASGPQPLANAAPSLQPPAQLPVLPSAQPSSSNGTFHPDPSAVGQVQWVRGAVPDMVTRSPDDKEDRIVGGTEATLGQFPHQVSIRKDGFTPFCGGSIVSAKYVLTAAHCFDDKKNMWKLMLVAAGTLTWRTLSPGGVDMKVDSGVVHEKWVPGAVKKWYDIAAMKLVDKFPPWTANIKAIKLNDKETLKEGMDCQVSGWGRTVDADTAGPAEKMLFTVVQIKDNKMCSDKYGEQMGPGSVCAGYDPGGKDSCQGDSGGPLTCEGKLAGIVSFGHGCGVAGFPGVYTALPYHKEWIKKHTDALSGAAGHGASASSLVLHTVAMLALTRMISL